MKKLISAQTVKQAHQDGKKEIVAPSRTTIITPEAETVARELGLKFVDRVSAQSRQDGSPKNAVNEETVRKIIEMVLEKLPPGKRDLDAVKKVVVDVLTKSVS